MCEYIESLDVDLTIKALTLIVATIVAIKAIVEYRKTQKWKKNEFLAKEIKDFFSHKDVKKALLILDWNRIDIPLYDNEIPSNKTRSFLFVDETHLENSLATNPNSEFTDEETIIRKSFDEFLVKLSMFQNYIDNELIKIKDLKPYLEYWMKLLGDKNNSRKNPIYSEKYWNFINHFEYRQVKKLLKNFGYDIGN